MKKTLGILVLCVILAISCVALVSCKGKKTTATTGPAVTLAPTTSAPAHVHTPEVIPAVAPTCSAEGLTEGEKCACGEILKAQEPVAKLEHTPVTVPEVEATCTETGLTEGTKCSACGEVIIAQEEIPLADHTLEVVPGTLATCTEAGTTDGEKCSVCGEVTKEQEEVEALGHDFVNATPIATTKSDLITRGHVLQCYNCGEIDTDNVVKHTFDGGECTYCKLPEGCVVLPEDVENPIAPYVYAEGSILKLTNKARVFQTSAVQKVCYTFALNIPETLKDTEITLVFAADMATSKLATPYYELTVKNGLVSNVKKVVYDSATDSVVRITLPTVANTSTPLTFEYGTQQVINVYKYADSDWHLRVELGKNTARYIIDNSVTGGNYGVFADTAEAYYVSLDHNSYNTMSHTHVYGPEATCSNAQVCTICLEEANNGEKANHTYENKYTAATVNHYKVCTVCSTVDQASASEHTGGSYCTVCGKPKDLKINATSGLIFQNGTPVLPVTSAIYDKIGGLDATEEDPALTAQGTYTLKLTVNGDINPEAEGVYFHFAKQNLEDSGTLRAGPYYELSLVDGALNKYGIGADGDTDESNPVAGAFTELDGQIIKLAKGEYTCTINYTADPITHVAKLVITTSLNGESAVATVYTTIQQDADGNYTNAALEGLYTTFYNISNAEITLNEISYSAN